MEFSVYLQSSGGSSLFIIRNRLSSKWPACNNLDFILYTKNVITCYFMLSPPLQNTAAPDEPPELEKIRKWQQERQAKRLRGEYESAVVHLSEIVCQH